MIAALVAAFITMGGCSAPPVAPTSTSASGTQQSEAANPDRYRTSGRIGSVIRGDMPQLTLPHSGPAGRESPIGKIDTAATRTNPPQILASRAFAGPTQYPPQQFKAYGIVAFTSKAVSYDFPRHQMICNAYIASLPSYKEISTSINNQMVTVWPIETDSAADRINAMPLDYKLCKEAISSYGFVTALTAINDARNSNAKLDGLGPFLLAWSPSGQKGRPDALVLVSNLSNVTTFEQARQVFLRCSHDIVENPEIWENGWNNEKLKAMIRFWADRYGPKTLKVFGIASE